MTVDIEDDKGFPSYVQEPARGQRPAQYETHTDGAENPEDGKDNDLDLLGDSPGQGRSSLYVMG